MKYLRALLTPPPTVKGIKQTSETLVIIFEFGFLFFNVASISIKISSSTDCELYILAAYTGVTSISIIFKIFNL